MSFCVEIVLVISGAEIIHHRLIQLRLLLPILFYEKYKQQCQSLMIPSL